MHRLPFLALTGFLALGGAATAQSPNLDSIRHDNVVRLSFPDGGAVNPNGNRGLAATYLGLPTYQVPGLVRQSGHFFLSGATRGWADGTCLLGVVANPPPGPVGFCGQGGFWDPWYRAVYPGQDSDAVSFGIGGITPVAKGVTVTRFGTLRLLNLGGQPQTVGTVTLSPPLDAGQVAAIDDAAGPMRVQVDNGFFGYTLPRGLTLDGRPVDPASADGTTVLVDNWTRAVTPGNAGGRGARGATATFPSLDYYGESATSGLADRLAPGTHVMPDQVGMLNGDPKLRHYTVTIDGNYLAEVMYNGFNVTNADVVTNARIMEFVGVNNKTGTSTWNDLAPLGDLLDGKPFATQIFYGGCQNDDAAGLGSCGVWSYIDRGIKRGIVLANAPTSADMGQTEGILDLATTIDWKSVKSAGYVLWVDPGNSGTPRLVVDADGNMNDTSRIFVGAGGNGVTIAPDGSVTASGPVNTGGWTMRTARGDQTGHADASTGSIHLDRGVVPGRFELAQAPGCTATAAGLMVYLSDGRKPGEAAGQGSGVPAVCDTAFKGSAFQWNSVYDHQAARR